MKQPEQSYTAIETAHGFVFFTDTTEGQKNRQDFLQFMADHYFDPHFNLGPVNGKHSINSPFHSKNVILLL